MNKTAEEILKEAIAALNAANSGDGRSRQLSVAITHAETSLLWLKADEETKEAAS